MNIQNGLAALQAEDLSNIIRITRRKLEQAGLKTYTQVIEGKDGKRTVRVPVGPSESRAEADKAAQRIRKLDLPANVLAI